MRVRVEKKWYKVNRLKTFGIETVTGEIFLDAQIEEIITEAEWTKGRRYTNEN